MIIPATKSAIRLFHQGSLALSKVEENGIKVDEERLARAIRRTEKKCKRMRKELESHEIFETWKRRFGFKTSLTAPEQLAKIVFEDLGYKPVKERTKSKRLASDEEAFAHVVPKEPFVSDLFEYKRLTKALTTNLKGLQNEIVNGRVHAIYNLNIPVSFRSSCEAPNIQNQPVRNEDIGTLIRQCFIAPKNYRIGEIDYGKIEVCGAACYTEDPTLIAEVTDPKADMHRDTAMQMFCIDDPKQVTKPARQIAKNAYVFPQFYGSYYLECTKQVWDDINHYKVTTTSGVPLRKHLKRHGIKERGACDKGDEKRRPPDPVEGTFEYHLKEVEKDFWQNRFKVYAQWKKDWWAKYLKRGWFRMKTGFVCQGHFNRKQVCNYPIQGSAFHCLLWSLVRLQRWLEKNKCKTKILGQIHDSMIIQFHKREVDDVLQQAKKIMTVDIREAWDWIIIPLIIEAELAEEGEPWAKKKPYQIAA